MTLEAIKTDQAAEQIQQEEEPKKVASGLHGVIAGRVSGFLFVYLQQNRQGNVLDSSTTYDFKDGEKKRQPDVSFVSLEKMPVPLDEDLAFPPDLAVEVVSRNDSIYETEKEIIQYQKAGVRLIWVINPGSKLVDVYRLKDGLKRQSLLDEDELDGEEVLPSFKLKVKFVFE